FYDVPRLVAHIDDAARAALARFLSELLPAGGTILDLMSSYVSHLPDGARFRSVVGLGLNAEELAANRQLTGGVVHDVNRSPRLPFRGESFDSAVLSVSVQYLTRPVELFRDVARVLRPGAPLVVSYSNRMFPTKAVAIWHALDLNQRADLIESYFDLAGGYGPTAAVELTAEGTGGGDSLRVVHARRAQSAARGDV
ncbi:MAG: class I SAM-dependent methyltransferase, partial [Alphaproteobacteria bacterium]